MPSHDGGNRTGQRPTLVRVVGQTIAHDKRTQIGVPQAKSAKDMGVFRDGRSRVAGVVHENLLRRNKNANGCFKSIEIESSILAFEFHQIKRSKIASRIVEEDI